MKNMNVKVVKCYELKGMPLLATFEDGSAKFMTREEYDTLPDKVEITKYDRVVNIKKSSDSSKMVEYELFDEDKMILTFTDGSELIVWKEDFDRAFAVFVNESKEVIEQDYAIK